MTDAFDDMIHIFIEEAIELLEESELALLNLDGKLSAGNDQEQQESIGELFRGFHTIKGSAGLFDLSAIVEFTHVVESVLSKVRAGDIQLTDSLVSLFLESRDHLATLVNNIKGGHAESDSDKSTGRNLESQLQAYLDASGVVKNAEDLPASQVEGDLTENENWHISLRFAKTALQNGMDPYSYIKYLDNVGKVEKIEIITDAVPVISEIEPDLCYLGFELSLKSDADKQAIESVFEFVEDECTVCILAPKSRIDDYIAMIASLPESDMRIGEILLSCGALTEKELKQAIVQQEEKIDEATCAGEQEHPPMLGDLLVKSQAVNTSVVEVAAQKQEQDRQKADSSKSSVRVNANKLEQLIDLVGELVISGANAELSSRKLGDVKLVETMENMSRLVEEIRDTTLGLRMVPIGDTFNRFKRVVREACKDSDKDIELKISGEETELDKTLVEKIADPLVHLLRNAVDHGIETKAVRVDAGKDPWGTVCLDAFHDSGNIVIRVRDDGGGLNRDKILRKAAENGLVAEGENLSDSEVYRLIFEAGFSTADKVTNLSGRGVGMDVVRRNIESLRGQVEVHSEPGKGTTFDIRLPLTLAIIDGFEVSVGEAHYIIPLDSVEECIELEEFERVENHDSHYINLRDSILPYIRLREFFNLSGQPEGRENIVVVNYAGRRAGLVVDDLHGEHQTVIKPLGVIFQNLRSISGATILGSGDVALIADVQNLIQLLITSARGRSEHPDLLPLAEKRKLSVA